MLRKRQAYCLELLERLARTKPTYKDWNKYSILQCPDGIACQQASRQPIEVWASILPQCCAGKAWAQNKLARNEQIVVGVGQLWELKTALFFKETWWAWRKQMFYTLRKQLERGQKQLLNKLFFWHIARPSSSFSFFFWYLGLNSGPHTCSTGTLPLKPLL
jgi:hypothetical protein